MDKAVLFFSYLIEYYILLSFCRSMFTKRVKDCTLYIVSAVLYLLCYAAFIIADNTMLNIITFYVANLVIISRLYKCKTVPALLYGAFLSAAVTGCEYLTMLILSIGTRNIDTYKKDLVTFTIMILISKMLYMIVVKIFTAVGKTLKGEKNSSTPAFLFIFPVCSIVILYSFWRIETTNKEPPRTHIVILISTISIIVAVILTYMFYASTNTKLQEAYEASVEAEKVNADKAYFNIIAEQNEKLREFKHDEKNHLEVIKTLAKGTPACEYIDSLYGKLNENSLSQSSDNRMFDLIINKYRSICASRKIDFELNSGKADFDYIKNDDLISLMSNILDNAVEAATDSEGKYIDLTVKNAGGYEMIICENSIKTAPIINKGEFKTTKSDSKSHGFGMKIIKRIVKNYSGELNCEVNRESFKLCVSFPYKEK